MADGDSTEGLGFVDDLSGRDVPVSERHDAASTRGPRPGSWVLAQPATNASIRVTSAILVMLTIAAVVWTVISTIPAVTLAIMPACSGQRTTSCIRASTATVQQSYQADIPGEPAGETTVYLTDVNGCQTCLRVISMVPSSSLTSLSAGDHVTVLDSIDGGGHAVPIAVDQGSQTSLIAASGRSIAPFVTFWIVALFVWWVGIAVHQVPVVRSGTAAAASLRHRRWAAFGYRVSTVIVGLMLAGRRPLAIDEWTLAGEGVFDHALVIPRAPGRSPNYRAIPGIGPLLARLLLVVFLSALVTAVFASFAAATTPRFSIVALVVVGGIAFVWFGYRHVVRWLGCRLTLDPDGVTVTRFFRTATFAWSEVGEWRPRIWAGPEIRFGRKGTKTSTTVLLAPFLNFTRANDGMWTLVPTSDAWRPTLLQRIAHQTKS